ncbi:MAG TPA: hypothetical protein VER55_04455 [Ardenticatenaceae bacterium]|nr:hypothetical protein [Ardenticatenaceae bacterium]
MMLLVHILAGGLGIVSGFVALYAAKGARLHRKSGMLFVYAMVTMALGGAVIGALKTQDVNVIAGSLTAYLVITALTAVRPPATGSRWLDVGAMLVALAIGLRSVTWGFALLASGESASDGVPAPLFFVFGAGALWASVSDVRMIRSGGLRGAPRLTRHLWRMCLALFIAAGSFFLGQADEFPEALRIPGLLAVPVLLPLLAMLYWRWRLRAGRTSAVVLVTTAREAV